MWKLAHGLAILAVMVLGLSNPASYQPEAPLWSVMVTALWLGITFAGFILVILQACRERRPAR